MAEIIWTKPTLEQLNDIAEYIALDNAQAARSVVKNVFDKVDRLNNFPLSGCVLPELPNSIYREIIVNPCRIFYRIQNNTVYIIHIMRDTQQLRKYMLSLSVIQPKTINYENQ